jgi:hypothetical protein
MDTTVCNGEMQKANMSGITYGGGGLAGVAAAIDRGKSADQVAQGCMAQKGYVEVPEDQVAAKQQQLAEVAAERARREAAAAPPPPHATRHAAPKPNPQQAPQT